MLVVPVFCQLDLEVLKLLMKLLIKANHVFN